MGNSKGTDYSAQDTGNPVTDRSVILRFKDHFSVHAADYAAARPDYPAALFQWLADRVDGHELAWDCATGNGQAAHALARHFAHVVATDASAEQIANAVPLPGVEYRVATAETPGLDRASVDLVTVAQALHWFDRPRFYDAARHVLRPGGLLAVWGYGLFTVTPPLDECIRDFYTRVVGPYWPLERRLIDERYETLDFPFREVTPPALEMERSWTLDRVLAYLRTWSAVQRYRTREGRDPLALVADDIARLWGQQAQRVVRWPLYLRVGRRG